MAINNFDYDDLLPAGLQFVEGGPYIPSRMLKAHENGDMVFLCGAGVSISAGLPTFKGLVDCIYKKLGGGLEHRTQHEEDAYEKERFDEVLQRLAGRIPGDGMFKVKELAVECINDTQSGESSAQKGLHHSLMTLSFGVSMSNKIVTTNYDNLLSLAIKDEQSDIRMYVFPSLPLDEDWNGVAHIHGSIPNEIHHQSSEWFLKNLILTDADLGRAYSSEARIAGNFLRRLTMEKSVCFVGYSVTDTEVRHWLAALSAMEGQTREHFALVTPNQLANGEMEDLDDMRYGWFSKGVTPIVYHSYETEDEDVNSHDMLASTLAEWAECRKEGKTTVAERIVVSGNPNSNIDGQKLRWSLFDFEAANKFSQIDPTPTIEWFPYLEDMIIPATNPNLVHPAEAPPTPRQRLPAVSLSLLTWLAKYAYRLDVFKWFLNKGGGFAKHVDGFWAARLKDTTPEFSDAMRTLWGYLMGGAFYINRNRLDGSYKWIEDAEEYGITTPLSSRLYFLLSPKITHGRTSFLSLMEEDNNSMNYIASVLGLDVDVPRSEDFTKSGNQDERWRKEIFKLLPTFSLLLEQACEYLLVLDKIRDDRDMSCLLLPSIEPHEQNHDYLLGWTSLIALTRDAWDATLKENHELAEIYLCQWSELPYPCFRRLALYGCSYKSMPVDIVQQKIAEEKDRWIWNSDMTREMCRFLANRTTDLSPMYVQEIENIIASKSQDKNEHWIWLYLTRMKMSGYSLGEKAQKLLDTINKKHPQWIENSSERDEFSVWRNGSADGGWIDSLDDGDSIFGQRGTLNTEIETEEDWFEIREIFASKEAIILHDKSGSYANSLASRMETAARKGWASETEILEVSDKIFSQEYQGMQVWSNDGLMSHPLSVAINHPHGRTAKALMCSLFRESRSKDTLLPTEYRELLQKILQDDSKVHAKCIIASQTNNLFIVDKEWTEEYLLPKFARSNVKESNAIWTGFLWAVSVIPEVVKRLVPHVVDLAENIESLPTERYNDFHPFICFLVWAISQCEKEVFLEYDNRLQSSFASWSPENIAEVSSALKDHLESATDKESCWSESILPFYQNYFPKKEHKNSYLTSHRMGEICLLSGQKFPEALYNLKIWLPYEDNSDPLEDAHIFAEQLTETGLDTKFPEESLIFLDALIAPKTIIYFPEPILKCLSNIESARSSVRSVEEYKRLRKQFPESRNS